MFLDMGYSHDLFWSLSIAEIYDYIKSEGRKRKRKEEEKKADLTDLIQVLWNQNLQLLNMYASAGKDSDTQLMQLHEYYPGLFEAPAQEDGQMDYQMELYKAQFTDFASRHNARRKQGGENDGRNDT